MTTLMLCDCTCMAKVELGVVVEVVHGTQQMDSAAGEHKGAPWSNL